MLATILFALLVASWIYFYFFFQRQRREIQLITHARDEIVAEESRVFEFLHGLGEAFLGDIRSGDLHRLIVEGATRVLGAHGGALYLLDRHGEKLVPTFISKSCPPLVEVPNRILAQVESTPVALQSYLRLHAVEPGQGLIGAVWKERQPLLLGANDERLSVLRDTTLQTASAMLAPLIYADQNLGALAVANGPMGVEFTEMDFAVFKAIAEQSAFALYNAVIYSEANEKKRIDLDLQVAHEIQRILLPSAAPEMKSFDISGVNIPARQVSGDYYGYIQVSGDKWGVAVADVSGKGIPASLIMAMCRSVLRSRAMDNSSPADVLRKVNRELYPDIKEDMFISMAYLLLDDNSSAVTLCRAGHDAPLLYSAKEQTVSQLNPPGMALGIDSGDVFDRITGDFSVTLETGDCLILYTDGVTEALDSRGMEFGLKKMIQSIQFSAGDSAVSIVKRITDDIQNFIGNYPQNDDITLIVIRRK